MSPEELKEFEEMALMEEFEASDTGDVGETVDSPVEAAALGFVEGVPFAKDVASGVGAAAELAPGSFLEGARAGGLTGAMIGAGIDLIANEDKSIEQFSEQYKKNLDGLNEQINEAEDKYPTAAFIGDVAGGISTAAVTAGIGGATLLGAGVEGALSGISRTEDRDIANSAGAAIVGGLFGTAGQAVGSAVSKRLVEPGVGAAKDFLAKKFRDKAAKSTFDFFANMDGSTHKAFIEHAYKFKGAGNPNKTLKEAGSEIGSDILDLGIIKKDSTPETIFKDSKRVIDKLESDRASLLSTIQKSFPEEEVTKSGEAILDAFGTRVREALRDPNATASQQLAAKNAWEELSNIFTSVNPKTGEITSKLKTVADLDAIRRNLDLTIEAGSSATQPGQVLKNKLFKDFNSQLRDHVDDLVDGLGARLEEAPLSSYKKLKQELSLSHMVKKAADKDVKRLKHGAMLTDLRELVNLRRVTFALGFGGKLFANPLVGLGAAAVEVAAKRSSGTAGAAAGFDNLSKYIAANPDSAITSRLGRAVSLATMEDFFEDAQAADEYLTEEISYAMAGAQLGTKPLERTNQSLIDNSNAIATLLRAVSPEAAKSFNEAMETQDPVALEKIGAMIAEMPEAQPFVAPGEGWEGKLHSEEQKKAKLDEMRTQDMSYAQFLFGAGALKKNGTIPKVEPEPDRFKLWKSNKGEKPEI